MSEEMKTELVEIWEVTMSPAWTGALVKALAAAQLKFKPVVKQTDNAAFMRGGKASKYADLAEYIDATQEALASNGLVVSQWPDVASEAKSMSLVSYLMHESGEWMRGRLTLPATGRDGFTAQSCGSSITYARRYSYAAITGCASEDDDGNSASGRGTSEAAQAVGKAKVEDLTKKLKDSIDVVNAKKNGQEALFYVWYDESQTAEITGAESLKTAHKDLLKKLWNPAARALIANADQLESLKYELEQRKVEFRPLKAANA
jgi:hypothetical protein